MIQSIVIVNLAKNCLLHISAVHLSILCACYLCWLALPSTLAGCAIALTLQAQRSEVTLALAFGKRKGALRPSYTQQSARSLFFCSFAVQSTSSPLLFSNPWDAVSAVLFKNCGSLLRVTAAVVFL